MILPIYLEPQPVLREKAASIDTELIGTQNFQILLDDMIETMRQADGIGLAAPQIGKSERFTVIDLPLIDKSSSEALILINPIITRKSLKKNIMEEGCLSIPGIYGKVKRHNQIYVIFTDRHGQRQKRITRGLLARVILHEVDHLNGILFTDKLVSEVQGKQQTPNYPHIA